MLFLHASELKKEKQQLNEQFEENQLDEDELDEDEFDNYDDGDDW